MKTQNCTRFWMLGGALLLLGTAACGRGKIIGASLPAPTVDGLPQKTNQVPLSVTGTRAAGTAVWLQLTSEADAQQAAAAGGDVNWSYGLQLREGPNSFVAFATDEASKRFSDAVGPIEIVLDTIPPMTPTIDDFPNPYFSESGADVQMVFTGIKGADGNLLIDDTEEIGIDGLTTWTFARTLGLGPHEMVLQSADDVGNRSEAVTLSIVITNVPGPIIDPVTSPTRIRHQVVTGSRAANTSAYLRRPGATDVLLSVVAGGEVDGGPRVALSTDLSLREGENPFSFFARREGNPYESQPATAVIVLDTIPPPPPTIDDPQSPTSAPQAAITGSRAADGDLCVRRDPQPTCTEVLPVDGTTAISVPVDLAMGNNHVCFSSVDLAGNASEEVCKSIVRVEPSTVQILSPASGAMVGGSSVPVEVQAIPGGTGTIESVEVCLDGTTCTTATREGSTNIYNATVALTGLSDNSTHTITATVHDSYGGTFTASISVVYSSIGILVLSDSLSPTDAQTPRVAVDGAGRVHVVWADACIEVAYSATPAAGKCAESTADNLPFDIFYRVLDGGTWGPIKLISQVSHAEWQAGRGDGDSREPAIAVASDGIVHIVWAESGNVLDKGNDRDIVHRTLDPATGNLGALTVVTNSTEDEYSPALAASPDGAVHLVFDRRTSDTDHDIYYRRWTSSGGFGAELLVSNDANDGDSRWPVIAADKDSVAHIVWSDTGTIQAGVGKDCANHSGGADSSGQCAARGYPCAWVTGACVEQKVQSASTIPRDGSNDIWDIFYRRVSAGTTLTGYVLVSDNLNDGTSNLPAIAIDPADTEKIVRIAWQDTAETQGFTGQNIWYREYVGGFVNSPYTPVSDGVATASQPSIALLGGADVAVCWSEGANPDIYCNMGGSGIFVSDSASSAAVTDNRSTAPVIARASATGVHVIWVDKSTIIASDADKPSGGGPTLDIFYKVVSF